MATIKAGKEFEALFNNAAIGIIVTNTTGNIIMVNQFALRQFGYQDGELTDERIEVLIPSRYRGKHVQHRENYHGSKAHSRPMGVGMDLYAVKKDGTEFPVEVSLSPYTTEEGQFAIAFISDISIRKKSELALLQLNADLERKVDERTKSLSDALEKEKELNELKSRFVSMASHEFRTPLSTILSSAFLISKYTKTDEQSKRDKHIQRVVSSGNMLNDILNDFLSVGKIEEGRIQVRPAEMDIEAEVNNLVKEIQPLLKKSQKIVYNHVGHNIVMLDLSLFKHILMNLLSNAIKFSDAGTDISVNTEKDAIGLVIKVKDKGIGISKADQEHLFERFFRGENAGNIQGTGLGLHIVSKYVELMDGTLELKSDIGKGTEFIIKFKGE